MIEPGWRGRDHLVGLGIDAHRRLLARRLGVDLLCTDQPAAVVAGLRAAAPA